MGKKVKKDVKADEDDSFDPLLVESKQAPTVVLMLASPEETVQIKACEALYRFAVKSETNRKVIFDLGPTDAIVKLLTSEDRVVRRNAMMVLSTLTLLVDVRAYLRKKPETIAVVIRLLSPETESTVTIEFAALFLSYMATDFSSKVVICDHKGLEPLVNCLSASDPDVQKNSLETLCLMLQDHDSRHSLKDYNGFEPTLALFASEYPVIQKLSLTLIGLTALDVENRVVLREIGALDKLLEIIGNNKFNDLHVFALQALANALDDPQSIILMKDLGGLKKLVYFVTDTKPTEEEVAASAKDKGKKKGSAKKKGKADDKKGGNAAGEEEDESIPSVMLPEAKIQSCRGLARCAKNEDNRKLLHEAELEKMMITLLSHEDDGVKAAAALALAVLAESGLSRASIGEWGGIEPLVRMLRPDKVEVKEAALTAIATLIQANTVNAKQVLSVAHGASQLVNCLNLTADEYEQCVVHACVILVTMSAEPQMRADIVKANVLNAVLKPLQHSSAAVLSKAALVVASFVTDDDLRSEFRKIGGVDRLVPLLRSNTDEVRRSAAWALSLLIVDETMAQLVIGLGGMDILQELHLSDTRRNRFTELALNRLLDNSLSAKYAYTGCLSTTDQVTNGFYDVGMLKWGEPMRTLQDLLRDEVNNKKPILLVSLKPERLQLAAQKRAGATDTESNTNNTKSKPSSARSNKSGLDRSKRSGAGASNDGEERESTAPADSASVGAAASEVDPVPGDNRMLKSLEEAQKLTQLVALRDQIAALGQFVAARCGGAVDRDKVQSFRCDLHIGQLRVQFRSNVIPLGYVQAGEHAQRALLFKVLADRIALPTTLVRGEYNAAWNEVWLPDDSRGVISASKLPPIRYIVDLMHKPGALLRAGSTEATQYTSV